MAVLIEIRDPVEFCGAEIKAPRIGGLGARWIVAMNQLIGFAIQLGPALDDLGESG
jgi:hypothetical protein